MRNYITETYLPNEIYICKRVCGNITFTTLPRTTETQTELTQCAKCGATILFSTTAAPIRIGYPRSRRLWNDVSTPVLNTSKLRKAKAKSYQTAMF